MHASWYWPPAQRFFAKLPRTCPNRTSETLCCEAGLRLEAALRSGLPARQFSLARPKLKREACAQLEFTSRECRGKRQWLVRKQVSTAVNIEGRRKLRPHNVIHAGKIRVIGTV